MRRNKQLIGSEECIDILRKRTSGVLAVLGDDGYPYAVPLSYIYHDTKIYFHCAKSGHKLDAIKNNCKVSFCVIDQDDIIPEEYTSYFRSVIVFGKAHILEADKEKREALEAIAVKYHPTDTIENRGKLIEKDYKPVCVVEIDIELITGKEAKELALKKR